MAAAPAGLASALQDRYRLDRELGQGGMATVYLAHDLRNSRKVALKVLRPELAAAMGPERFLQEIEVLARLQHPHILPLHDSGEAAGFLFYVMPYMEGESLRSRLDREKQLPLNDALRITREVADALGFAHRSGVVHRDIKPENILLGAGHAVVADFGIARAVSVAGGPRLTETGLVVGTPAYMSPEQAAGERDLDGRSDLYGLGCTLYEMLAGQPPFTGPTAESLVRQHIVAAPPPVTQLRPMVPVGITDLLQRALAKSPADQSAEELLTQLEAVVPPRAGTTPDAAPTVVARLGRGLPRAAVLLAVGVLMAAVLAAVWFLKPHPFALTTANALPVTSEPGVEYQPALSPDGNLVAYVTVRGGRRVVAVRGTKVVAGGGESRPAEGLVEDQVLPAWSPDGQFLRFTSGGALDPRAAWREVGLLGGAARPVELPRQARWVAWSREGGRAAIAIGESLFVYTIGDRGLRLLAVDSTAYALLSLAWSPDGRWIACVRGLDLWPFEANTSATSIWMVAARSGRRVALTDEENLNVSPVWLDARHLLFVSNRDGPREVYVVEVGATGPRGAAEKVPGGTDAHSISVSADGTRLAVAKLVIRQNVRAYPLRTPKPMSLRAGQPITSGTQVVEAHDVSPDGQWLVYDSNLRGNADIYKLRLDGGAPIPLVTGRKDEFHPVWSPDGTEVAYENQGEIWVVQREGGAATQLTKAPPYASNPLWSPDGLRLAFWTESRVGILARDRPGGPWSEPGQLTDTGCALLAWEKDGRGVLCRTTDHKQLVFVSASGTEVWRRDFPGGGLGNSVPVLSEDGSSFLAAEGPQGQKGVWAWPLAGGQPRLLVTVDDPSLSILPYPGAINVSHGKLYVTVAEYESDIWVMDLKR